MITLNPEFKAKWTIALRSKEYAQGKCALRSKDNKFCCIGVACDILDPTKWHQKHSDYTYATTTNGGMPDHATLNAIGLSEAAAWNLAHMNDDHGKTFAEIADHIEANL